MRPTGEERFRFRMLGAFEVWAGAAVLPFVLGPSATDLTDDVGTNLLRVIGVCLIVLGVFLLAAASRLPPGTFEAFVYLSAFLIVVHALVTPRGQMQVLDGVYLLSLGMFAAFGLPEHRAWTFVVVQCIGYAGALFANDLLFRPWIGAAAVVMIFGNTIVVLRLVDRLRSGALQDPLTGALNRRGLIEKSEPLRALAARERGKVSVALIDVDDFKLYNDVHGHAGGDRLLIDLVRDLRKNLRPYDLVARVGGDEFVIVLPNTPEEEAALVVKRIRTASPLPWSSGVTGWDPVLDIDRAMALADDRMYREKIQRRD